MKEKIIKNLHYIISLVLFIAIAYQTNQINSLKTKLDVQEDNLEKIDQSAGKVIADIVGVVKKHEEALLYISKQIEEPTIEEPVVEE